MKHSVVFRKLE